MNSNIIADVASLVFLLTGAFFALSASIGLIRFRSPWRGYTRLLSHRLLGSF